MIQRLRGCNAVGGRKARRFLCPHKQEAGWTLDAGRTGSVKFMAQSRRRRKAGDQLSKRKPKKASI